MPVQYERDDTRRQIRVTLTDPIAVADLIGSVEHQLADGAWQYGLLVDGRHLSNPPPATDIKIFVSRVRQLVDAHGPRGPIACVARKAGVISAAQIYIFLGGKTESIEVFWAQDDAQQWLDARATT